MCLGIPGKIKEIYSQENIRMAKVDLNGVELEACLEVTPEAKSGDYVIVHAGFAINTLSEAEALETLELFKQMDTLQDNEDLKE